MKNGNAGIAFRLVAACVLVFFTGCLSTTPQHVEIVVNEPDARISVNGSPAGEGIARLDGIKAADGPMDVSVAHEDYGEVTMQLVPDREEKWGQKHEELYIFGIVTSAIAIGIGGVLAETAGIDWALSLEGDTNIFENPKRVFFFGITSLTGGIIATVRLRRSKEYSWYSQYPLDISASRNYDELGYHKSSGYNKAGFNREGLSADGQSYEGPLYDWKMEGIGSWTRADGSNYTGMLYGGLPDGMGRFVDTEGGLFIGTWEDGAEEGAGIYLAADGSQNREVWKGGEKLSSAPAGKIRSEARSYLFFGEGNRGGWAHGPGDAFSTDLSIRITGARFSDGNLVSGTMIMPDGTVYRGKFDAMVLTEGEILRPDGTYYRGPLVKGVPEGLGYLRSSDGSVYEGEIRAALFSGDGKLTLSNGDVYEGAFLDGKPHGEGIYRNASEGSIEKCEFYEGKRIDQAYIIRIERAKAEEERRIKEEQAKAAAAEQARQERLRQQRLAEQKAAAEARKSWGAIGMGLGAAVLGSSVGMDAGEAALLGASVARDVYEDTGGTHTRAAGAAITANRRTMADYEQKYGASDLSGTREYTRSVTSLPGVNQPVVSSLPEPAARPRPAATASASPASSGTGSRTGSVPPSAQQEKPKGIPACVYVWKTENGKYRAHGPTQLVTLSYETEEEVLELAGIDRGNRTIVRTISHPMPGHSGGIIYVLSDPPLEPYEDNVAEKYGFASLFSN